MRGGEEKRDLRKEIGQEIKKEEGKISKQKHLLKGQFAKKARERIKASEKRIATLKRLSKNILNIVPTPKTGVNKENMNLQKKLEKVKSMDNLEDMFKVYEGGKKRRKRKKRSVKKKRSIKKRRSVKKRKPGRPRKSKRKK